MSTHGPAVQLLLKTTNAETADNVGIQKLKQFLMVNIKTKFPRGISDQTISASGSYGLTKRVRPGPGLQQVIEETVPHNDIEEASGSKQQASSNKLREIQASSGKHQAPSTKVQAPSHKLQAPGPWILEKVSR